MKEIYFFAKRFLSSPMSIGSLFPSSKHLGDCLTEQSMLGIPTPKRYLEVGGGSGALTRQILKKMGAEDQLDVVELDTKFCAILREQFKNVANVSIYESSILDFDRDNYDVLISSLPLNAFPATVVHEILTKYESLVKKGGSLSYFEYLGLKRIKKALLFGEKCSDYKDTLSLTSRFVNKYGKEIQNVWRNFPPARVIHCKM